MANLTSVGITSGVPSSGTGTVSTIDQLLAVGAPISNGTSAVQVAITGASSVVTSTMSALVVQVSSLSPSHLVTLSSNPTVIVSSALTINSGTVTLSSNPTLAGGTVTLSSNPTLAGGTITSVSSGAVSITVGSNTANVLAGSSNVTSTMASLVVSISSNGAGILATGTPTTPSSQYISAVVVGDLGVGGANSSASNPVAVGGIYNSTNPTSVTSGQRVQAWFDKSGRQITIGSLRALKGVQLTAISCSVTETNITPSSTGGNFLDIYGLILANLSSVNVQQVTIKDSSGGTSRLIFDVPASDTRGFMLPSESAVPQAASSQAWTATLSNSSGPFQVTALYVTNV